MARLESWKSVQSQGWETPQPNSNSWSKIPSISPVWGSPRATSTGSCTVSQPPWPGHLPHSAFMVLLKSSLPCPPHPLPKSSSRWGFSVLEAGCWQCDTGSASVVSAIPWKGLNLVWCASYGSPEAQKYIQKRVLWETQEPPNHNKYAIWQIYAGVLLSLEPFLQGNRCGFLSHPFVVLPVIYTILLITIVSNFRRVWTLTYLETFLWQQLLVQEQFMHDLTWFS